MEQEKQTIAERIIQRLEEDKVTPIARWRFTLRNSGFWTLWGLSVVLGACATAATIFVFLNSGWQYKNITHDSFFNFLLDVIPVFWLVSIGAMIMFGYFNIRNTTRGYRFSFYLVVISSVVVSFIGGTILYTLGVAGDIDGLRRPLPFSNPMAFIEEERWNDDRRGLASGMVKSFDKEKGELIITTFKGEEKLIFTSELGETDTTYLEIGSHIRIIGLSDIDNNQAFVACVVIPWKISSAYYPALQMYPQGDTQVERNQISERTSICKDVRPYQRYKETLITN